MLRTSTIKFFTERTLLSMILLGFTHVTGVLAEQNDLSRSAWSNKTITQDPEITNATLRRGKQVYDALCLACHDEIPEQIDPQGMPPMTGTQALQIRYQGELPAVLDQRTDLTPGYVRTIVRQGSNVMAAFRPTEISDEDLEAVAAYLSHNNK